MLHCLANARRDLVDRHQLPPIVSNITSTTVAVWKRLNDLVGSSEGGRRRRDPLDVQAEHALEKAFDHVEDHVENEDIRRLIRRAAVELSDLRPSTLDQARKLSPALQTLLERRAENLEDVVSRLLESWKTTETIRMF